MCISTTVKLVCQNLNVNKRLLRCSQNTFNFRVAREFIVFSKNGAREFIRNRRFVNVKCFSNFTRDIWIYSNRIKSTKLKYVTVKSVKSICTESGHIVKTYPFLIWTCSLIVPLHVILWYIFPFMKESIYNILQFGEGVALTPQLSLPDFVATHVSDKNNTRYSHIVNFWCSLQEFFLLNLRALYLFCVFSPLLLTYPLTYVSSRCFALWLYLLYTSVEYSGATFVKLGQWASTRRDLFSEDFCNLFSGLHQKVRPHAWLHTLRVLKKEYGENWQQMLHISTRQDPIGSGCIAQVYKGYVSTEFVPSSILKNIEKKTDKTHFEKGTGMGLNDVTVGKDKCDTDVLDTNVIPVAIKVLHPKVREAFQRDLKLMKAASRFLTFVFPKLHWVNLNQCVEEFAIVMRKQLDMQYEYQCLKKFSQDFQTSSSIKVPQPIPVFVRQNVLVETFEEGVSVSQILRSTEHSSQFKKELAGLGLDGLLQMVFVNNFVHADLHPGNMLVQNIEADKVKKNIVILEDVFDTMMVDIRPVEESSLKLVLLDCGITASLSPDDRLKFRAVFTAIVKGEGETVADLFLSKSPVNHCTDPELFRKEMAQLVVKGCKKLKSASKLKVADLMNDLFTVLSRHKIQLESNFATMIMAIAMLEGIGRTLDPDLNLLDRARPVLLKSFLG